MDTSMHFYTLDQIQSAQRTEVGETAFHLAQLQHQGYAVLPSITIPATVLNTFLETINWLEPLFSDLPNSTLHLDVENPRQLQSIARTIRQSIADAPPTSMAWISTVLNPIQGWSAARLILKPSLAIAGEEGWETLVSGGEGLIMPRVCPPTAVDLRTAIGQLWGDLFGAKSLLYWQRLGVSLQHVQLAVLVQPLATPLLSGECCIRDRSLEIRATWGIPEAIATGEVCPDWYRVDLATGQVLEQTLGQKLYRGVAAADLAGEVAVPSLQSGVDLVAIPPRDQDVAVLQAPVFDGLLDVARRLSETHTPSIILQWQAMEGEGGIRVWVSQVLPPGPGDRWPTGRSSKTLPTLPSPTRPPAAEVWGLGVAQGQASGMAWVVDHRTPSISELPDGCILITTTLLPTWLPQLSRVAAIVTEQGGLTSHGAIVAREMGIPAVVGVAQITHLFQTGDPITVDGDRGGIYRGTALPQPASTPMPARPVLPPRGRRSLRLWTNLSRWSSVATLGTLPVDGIGLVRSELALLELLDQRHPLDWIARGQEAVVLERLVAQLQNLAATLAPRPVFYRALDMRSNEYQLLQGSPALTPEVNPILGIHGTLSYTVNPTWFQLELSALRQVQQQGYSNLNLLLPFVRTVEEFQFCHQWVVRSGLPQVSAFQLWIMAEVPSVIWLLPDYVKAGVQGIAIGMNDLTQLLLAVDRDHPQMAAHFDKRHPAVLRAIAQLVRTAQQLNIPCSICGQIPLNDSNLLQTFMQWGVSAVSVEPHTLAAVAERLTEAAQALAPPNH
jgi:pyruvate,water dikinase